MHHVSHTVFWVFAKLERIQKNLDVKAISALTFLLHRGFHLQLDQQHTGKVQQHHANQ